jgi:hypothetical protein
LPDPDEGRAKQRMLGNIYLLAVREPGFHLLGENGGGGEATNELEASFRLLIAVAMALVDRQRTHNVAIASGDDTTAVSIRQNVTAV